MQVTTEQPQSESQAETKLKRGKKNYKFNAWNAIQDKPAKITWSQLYKICLTAKHQIREGLTNAKPESDSRNINVVESADNEKTSIYATCFMENQQANAVLDSGASNCVISKKFLDLLG